VFKKTMITALIGFGTIPMSAMATTSLPFGKRYDETLIKKAVNLPLPKLIALINETTDIKIASVRTELDREIPATELEKSPLVTKLKGEYPQPVKDYVSYSHQAFGLMVPKNDVDTKVSRNTIFVNEFMDGYGLIHEYMHSLFSLKDSGGSVPVPMAENYRISRKNQFMMGKVRQDFSLLTQANWRSDVLSALEDSTALMLKAVKENSSEEVLIERTLAHAIRPGSLYYNKLRAQNGKIYADTFLESIQRDFNQNVDDVGFMQSEIKFMDASVITEDERAADLARIAKMQESLRTYRAEVDKLEKFK
jgi:hypothetical protein